MNIDSNEIIFLKKLEVEEYLKIKALIEDFDYIKNARPDILQDLMKRLLEEIDMQCHCEQLELDLLDDLQSFK